MGLFKKTNPVTGVARQWGTEKRVQPLPSVHRRPSTRSIAMSRLGIMVTLLMWALYVITTIIKEFIEGPDTFSFQMQAISYLVVVTFLTFSALVYQLARQGALQRFRDHVRVPRAKLDAHFAKNQPTITVLVPSYAEEPEVIRKTLLSAALQEYPHKKIVLLIDDKPYPTDSDVLEKLNKTRAIASDIETLLSHPNSNARKAFESFIKKYKGKKLVDSDGVSSLAAAYDAAAHWLKEQARQEKINDHVDVFFKNQVFEELAKELRLTARALHAAVAENETLPYDRAAQLYQRLTWLFNAKLTSFERKRYASLSQEANKAMNLNSYIGLMGGSYQIKDVPGGQVLAPSRPKQADLTIEDSDFLLTLDADSILLRDYCLRLVYLLQQPGNERIAVTQTPYSSFRGASTRLERLASATTDIQHILHQGMTYYDATFWVGANAVIRKSALEDIAESEYVGGFEIKRYIQDRTVIEDTESSIDLGVHGWKLINYPERLSYSATPPDFGSLVVQRRRWANGGLLIMPKLLLQIKERKRRGERVRSMELAQRVNYMASIAWGSAGLVFLLAYPYDGRLLSPFVVLAAIPYFMAMASDLAYCGYKRTDIFRIYGFNIMLLPVNAAGVLKSLQQALTNKKIPFARTPKVKNRTLASPLFIIAPLAIIAFSALTFWRDYNAQNWGNAVFAGFNTVVTAWAFMAYVGVRHALIDVWSAYKNWLFIPVTETAKDEQDSRNDTIDWRAILYHGNSNQSLPLNVLAHDNTQPQGEKA